jgi:hypothetical protein
MHQFSVIFIVLSIFLLSVLAVPLPLDQSLDKRNSGDVRRPLDLPLCPETDHWSFRGHGSTMAWVHVAIITAIAIPLSPFPPSYMAQEVIVAK